ncbi:hypothetical protein BGZ80_009265, partial [Entomortierella chlamydospora]
MSTQDYDGSARSENKTIAALSHNASKPNSIHSGYGGHSVDTSPTQPLSTKTEKQITARSARSLRSTLPPSDNGILPEHGGQREQLSLFQCLKAVVFATKINIFLVFVPAGIIVNYLHAPDVAVFIINFIAIIPLAK